MPTHFPLRRWFSGRTQCLRPLTPSMRRLTILLGVLAGAQLLFLFWLNLTQLRYHLGYDASCDYLHAAEMYRQGKLFPDHWRDTTTSHLDSPVPLAALVAGNKPIRSGEEDSPTLNERYRDEADAQGIAWNDNFDHWGDCICYDNADEYAGPITLLAEPACFEALPDSLRSEFTFYAALNDDLAVYTCNENLLGL